MIIPCYNEADYLSATLKSLKLQKTSANYEVIVVDNNSTDDTVSIAKKFRVKVINETIPGVCAARQAGTLAAKGEIIISTDADTIFSPNWINFIDQMFQQNPNFVALGGPCRYYDGPWWGKSYTHFLFGWSYLYYLIFGHPGYVTATNLAFKKTAWSGYDLNLMQGGDELGLLHQLRSVGKVGFSLNNTTYTSGRRLEKGIFYNIFVTFLYYYLAAYYLNSYFKRNIIGSAPAFRKSYTPKNIPKLAMNMLIIALICLPLLYMGRGRVSTFISDGTQDIRPFINRLF